jgi:hypothetical protein
MNFYFAFYLKIYINNGISQDDNAFEFCTRIDGIQLPKSGYLGVTAATGGLADDHDVLEFLTTTYSDKQAATQNQGATDDQAKKYKEEYEKYEEDLKKQQAEFVLNDYIFISNNFNSFSYQKDHPDLTTPLSEQQLVFIKKKIFFNFLCSLICSTKVNMIGNFVPS